MTDKELLALAAKAVGGLLYVADLDAWIECDEATGARGSWWKPLADDGAALRLAVSLSIPMEFRGAGMGHSNTPENHRVMCGKYWDGAESRYDMMGERHGCDKHAATRRAIVRAAAEIGKAMP